MKKSILLFVFLFAALLQVSAQKCSNSQPRPIIGEQRPCPGTEEVYYILREPGYSVLQWEVPRAFAGEGPVGWEILVEQLEEADYPEPLVYSFEDYFAVKVLVGKKPGTMKVTVYHPECGSKVATLPVMPGLSFEVEVSGDPTPCIGEETTYTATVSVNQNGPKPANFTYKWHFPSGWTVVGPEDQSSITFIPNDNPLNNSGPVWVEVDDVANNTNNGNGLGPKGYCTSASNIIGVIPEDCGGVDPFPIELSSFKGKATASGVELTWTTASEKDNDRFEVQRSTDGKDFKTIGTVKGAGNSATALSYSYLDKNASKGTNYYRLNQVDTDGTASLSQVIAMENNSATATAGMSIYPNPATGDDLTIALDGDNMNNKTYVITISDINGRKVFEQNMSASGNSEINLSLAKQKISKGLYMIKVQGDNLIQTRKLLINK